MATSSPYPSMPLPFIMTDDTGRFHINADTAQVLSRIEKPLVVVAIAGKYRTGKSFLMNRLAAETVKPTLKPDTHPKFVLKRSEAESSLHTIEEPVKEEFPDVRSMVKHWTMKGYGQFEQKQTKASSARHTSLQTRVKEELNDVRSMVTHWTMKGYGQFVKKQPKASSALQTLLQTKAETVKPTLKPDTHPKFVFNRSEAESSLHTIEEPVEEEFIDVRSMVKRWTMKGYGQFEQKQTKASSARHTSLQTRAETVKPTLKPDTHPKLVFERYGKFEQEQPKASPVLLTPLQTREIGLSSKISGFSLGNTVQSHTKGIWVWPVRHPRDEKKCLLLLDTEGLGDVEKANGEHDTWLFVMAVLLSNILVYNTVGTLDHSGLEQLQYVKDMAQYVKARVGSHEDNPNNLDKYFPSLIICVRDFSLTLKLNGSPCTADIYMEHCFKIRKPETQRGQEEANKTFNKERELLCHYFKKRKCFMFPMPVNSEDLSKLETIPDKDLKPGFLKVANEFTSHIYQEAKCKNIDGVILTGQLFLQVAELYVAAQRSGDMVCIENTRVQVVQLANLQPMEDAKALYQRQMESIEVHLPLKIWQLHQHHDRCMEQALNLFYSHAVLDWDHKHEKELMEHMETTCLKLVKQNKQRSQEKCRIRLTELYRLVDERYHSFMQPGGFIKYQAMMKKIEVDYFDTTGLGDEMATMFKEFLKQKKDRGDTILMVDKTLTSVQQQEIANKQTEKIMELQKKTMKEEQENHKEEIEFLENQCKKLQNMFGKYAQVIKTNTDEKIQEIQLNHAKMMQSKSKKRCTIS